MWDNTLTGTNGADGLNTGEAAISTGANSQIGRGSSIAGSAGANTGSGGGGSGISVTFSGEGGSGIVVLRYAV